MSARTPEQLGLTVDHIADTIRNPRLFSIVVKDCAEDIESMRHCRDSLIAGIQLVAAMTIMCSLDEETVLKRIQQPLLGVA